MARLTLKQLDDHMLIAEGQLASLFLASDNHYAQIGAMYRRLDRQAEQIQQLTQLIEEQADTIQRLSRWNNEATRRILALEKRLDQQSSEINQLAESLKDIGDDEALNHQWLDRQQARIVALEKRDNDAIETLNQRISCAAATLRREIRDGDYATLEEVAQLRNRVTTHEPQAINDAIRNAHNATMRMDIHSKWISQLFDRLNESEVKE